MEQRTGHPCRSHAGAAGRAARRRSLAGGGRDRAPERRRLARRGTLVPAARAGGSRRGPLRPTPAARPEGRTPLSLRHVRRRPRHAARPAPGAAAGRRRRRQAARRSQPSPGGSAGAHGPRALDRAGSARAAPRRTVQRAGPARPAGQSARLLFRNRRAEPRRRGRGRRLPRPCAPDAAPRRALPRRTRRDPRSPAATRHARARPDGQHRQPPAAGSARAHAGGTRHESRGARRQPAPRRTRGAGPQRPPRAALARCQLRCRAQHRRDRIPGAPGRGDGRSAARAEARRPLLRGVFRSMVSEQGDRGLVPPARLRTPGTGAEPVPRCRFRRTAYRVAAREFSDPLFLVRGRRRA